MTRMVLTAVLGVLLTVPAGCCSTEKKTSQHRDVSAVQTAVFRGDEKIFAETVQSATCSGPWLWNWCYVRCEDARECCGGVINYWLERKRECESDPVRAKEAIERACNECNRVCR